MESKGKEVMPMTKVLIERAERTSLRVFIYNDQEERWALLGAIECPREAEIAVTEWPEATDRKFWVVSTTSPEGRMIATLVADEVVYTQSEKEQEVRG